MDLTAMELDEHSEAADPRLVSAVLAAMDARAAYGSVRSHGSSGAGSNRGAQGASGGYERRLPTMKHLTPVEVKAYMEEGKCFGCAKKDHSSRECPRRKIVDGRVTWSGK
jgi:hypothetical protein